MPQPDKILHEAEVTATGGRGCPHSNATRDNIDVKPTVL